MICLGYSNAVKSDQLKWLPNGSELQMTTYDSSAKAKSYTSFSCSQDSMPEFSKKPLGVRFDDIILAKLGPGQVLFLFLGCGHLFLCTKRFCFLFIQITGIVQEIIWEVRCILIVALALDKMILVQFSLW